MPLCNDHIVGRLALFPKYLSSVSGVFDYEQLFTFTKLRDENGKPTKTSGWSIASEIMARGASGVHQYGRQSTAIQNAAYIERTGKKPDPESMYLGYFRFAARALNGFSCKHHSLEIRWWPEHDAVCHFQLEITPTPKTPKVELRNERRLLTRAVCEQVSAFVCNDDAAAVGEITSHIDALLDGFEDEFSKTTRE